MSVSDPPRVQTGLDVLARQRFELLAGRRVGLVAHPASVTADLQHAVESIASAPNVRLVALFGPEHGLSGHAQDLIAVGDELDAGGLRIVSLYGKTLESLVPTEEQFDGLDVLVIDLQDVGSRYYTFQATMLYCLQTASKIGLPVIVLDRPNPLGGQAVEGPAVQPGFESFVGVHSVSIRHGLTIGEMARLYHSELGLACELTIISCEGWRRSMSFEQTRLAWVPPSPNIPTMETAWVYAGQCLLEGTNLSEGRGTTRPFELCGAPGIDAGKLAKRLNDEGYAGVRFRAACFEPTFQKHAGRLCGGVQIHVTDRESFRPVLTGLATLIALRDLAGPSFDWRREPYEFVADRLAIDLLFGSARERLAVEAGATARQISEAWRGDEDSFRARRLSHCLYEA